jgi:hypothetical protein
MFMRRIRSCLCSSLRERFGGMARFRPFLESKTSCSDACWPWSMIFLVPSLEKWQIVFSGGDGVSMAISISKGVQAPER